MEDDKVVTDLRSELWEKERKLTDIRLEALSSAHQLEQLQDAMTSMQVNDCFLFFLLNTLIFKDILLTKGFKISLQGKNQHSHQYSLHIV